MKKICCLLLVLTLCIGAMGALASEERVKLTVAVSEDIIVEDWETNEMTKYLEEVGGFDLDFMVLPKTDYVNKLNLMVLDGGKDLPDIIMAAPTDEMLYAWAQTGAIIPLTEYYDNPELSANIHEAFDRIGVDYRPQITLPDGEIYAIPSFNQSYGNEHPSKLFVYQPFLDTLGLDVPTTTEEFYDVLKAVVEQDPNGNGLKDEIGVLGAAFDKGITANWSGSFFPALMNSFVYAGGGREYLTVNDGITGVAYTQDGWRQGLEYLARLYGEGLIAPESLTQDQTAFKATFNSEEPTVFMMSTYTATGQLDGSSTRKTEYVGIMPLVGPEGVSYISYEPSVAVGRMMISANCQNPEAAFRLGDLMSTELMSIWTRWGQVDVDWIYFADAENPDDYEGLYETAGFDKYIVCYDDATFWSSGTLQNRAWRQQGPYVRQYAIANGQSMEKGAVTPQQTMLSEYQYALHNSGKAPEEVIPKLIFNEQESKTVSTVLADLLSYANEFAANVIAGNIVIDDGVWAGYLAELQMIGVEDYVAAVQSAYDRMYK